MSTKTESDEAKALAKACATAVRDATGFAHTRMLFEAKATGDGWVVVATCPFLEGGKHVAGQTRLGGPRKVTTVAEGLAVARKGEAARKAGVKPRELAVVHRDRGCWRPGR